jgi:prepilin-type N-terminal cleavage/methylation domain-containing protein
LSYRANNRGFTLIEILVAIVLFAVGALLAARMQTSSVRSTTFGKEALLAITAAQTLTEQLKEEPSLGNFGTIIANGGSGPVLLRPDTTPANIQAGTGGIQAQIIPGMTIQWTVTNTNGTTPNRYTTVQVTIQWAGNSRNYSTSTIISEN